MRKIYKCTVELWTVLCTLDLYYVYACAHWLNIVETDVNVVAVIIGVVVVLK